MTLINLKLMARIMIVSMKMKFALLLTLFNYQVNAVELSNTSNLEKVAFEAKLLPDLVGLGGLRDDFGRSMAIDGNRMVVGASGAQGYGLVVVYELENGEYKKSAILQALKKGSSSKFGKQVALFENTIFVAATEQDGGSSVVYVYEFDGEKWIESTKLMHDGSENLGYVRSMVADNGRLVIGGVTVKIFEKNNDIWQESHTLISEDENSSSGFGQSISVSGNYILVGAPYGRGRGKVYLYKFDNQSWQLDFVFLAPMTDSTHNTFGVSISIKDDRVLIGSPNSGSVDSSYYFGIAFLYHLSESGEWQIEQTFEETSTKFNGQFGSTVKLFDDNFFIASWDSNQHDFGYDTVVLGAVYVYGKTGEEMLWQKKAVFSPESNKASAYFGATIAYGNDSLFVGSSNGISSRQGLVRRFEVDSMVGEMNETQLIKMEKGPAYSKFGGSVSVFANRVLVGSKQDISLGFNVGSASVFELKNSEWHLQQKLYPHDAMEILKFGSSVSLSDKYAVVSAGYEDSLAAYVFELIDGNWIEIQKIELPSEFSYDGVGLKVDIDGTRLAIGSSSYHYNLPNESGSGAVFIYELINSHWQQTAHLEPNNSNDNPLGFGNAVSLSGDRILIGAKYDYMEDFIENYDTGSAYVFDLVNGNWEQAAKLIASDAQRKYMFGYSVSLLNNQLLVGAPSHSHIKQIGKAYLFELSQENLWEEKKIFTSGVESYNDGFGSSVSLSQSQLVISAPFDRVVEDKPVGSLYAFDRSNDWLKTKIEFENTNIYSNIGHSIDVFENRIVSGAFGDNEKGVNAGATYIVNRTPYNKIQSSHSALWFNPQQSGHGLSTYMLDGNRMVAFWYVYDNEGHPLWLLGLGTHDGYKAVLNVTTAQGAMFPPLFNSEDVDWSNWGTFELGFYNCNQGLFKWLSNNNSEFESGELNIDRLTHTQDLPCDDISPQTSPKLAEKSSITGQMQAANTALWFDPMQSGHGINVYMLDNNRIIVFWHVYDNTGKPIWLFGIGEHNNGMAVLNVTSTSGAISPPYFNSNDVVSKDWGLFELEFNDCNNGIFRWVPKSNTNYSAGEMNVTRLVKVSGLSCN